MSLPERPNLSPEKREEILNHCPLLKAFIDRSKPFEIWRRDVESLNEQLGKGFEELWGERWEWRILSVATRIGKRLKVYHEDVSVKEAMWIAKSLFLIGYEVGDEHKTLDFTLDIFFKLEDNNFLNPKLVAPEWGMCTIFSFNMGIVDVGVIARKLEREKEFGNTPDIFVDFISSLDFGDEV